MFVDFLDERYVSQGCYVIRNFRVDPLDPETPIVFFGGFSLFDRWSNELMQILDLRQNQHFNLIVSNRMNEVSYILENCRLTNVVLNESFTQENIIDVEWIASNLQYYEHGTGLVTAQGREIDVLMAPPIPVPRQKSFVEEKINWKKEGF